MTQGLRSRRRPGPPAEPRQGAQTHLEDRTRRNPEHPSRAESPPAVAAHIGRPCDPVTGLPARQAVLTHLRQLIGHPDAVIIKLSVQLGRGSEEDSLDGPTGQLMMVHAAAALTQQLRGRDWMGRAAASRFVIVTHGSLTDAEATARRLIHALTVNCVQAAGSPGVLVAAGISALHEAGDAGEVLRRAEVALLSAQHSGPGSIHQFADVVHTQSQRRGRLQRDLDGASSRGELGVVYQPIVDVDSGIAVSVEALLRWKHPTLGMVPPDEFIPLAEDTGHILDLTRWVLREAASCVASAYAELCVTVNISAHHLHSGGLVADVIEALHTTGLPAPRLTIELTESVLLQEEQAVEDLRALQDLGVKLALDDFGSGYSSLASLVTLPLDVIKMDRAFLTGLCSDRRRQAVYRSILDISIALGATVVVEGVETTDELAVLRSIGHRYVQGYIFSPPLPADGLLQLLTTRPEAGDTEGRRIWTL